MIWEYLSEKRKKNLYCLKCFNYWVTVQENKMELSVEFYTLYWVLNIKKKNSGQCGGRTHDIRVISTTL